MKQTANTFYVNINLNKKDKVIFELYNSLVLLIFYIPLTIAIVLDLNNFFYLIGVIVIFASILLNYFNRFFPNGKIIFDNYNRKLKIIKRSDISLFDYDEIIKVDIERSKEYFRAYSICKIKFQNDVEINLIIDKYYFSNPNKTSNKIKLIFKNILS